ncbi:MAG: DUF1003 domain-containing protein [Actinomycetes bacterium]
MPYRCSAAATSGTIIPVSTNPEPTAASADSGEEANPYRHIEGHAHLHGAFGDDVFGAIAERIALFFGTPTYIIVQTIIVIIWVSLNAIGVAFAWDVYPFVFLNLAFSLQAAYAAPLILLAQTRQAERERHAEVAATDHREEVANQHKEMLMENTHLTKETQALTEKVRALTEEIKTLTQQVSASLNRS